MTNSNVIAGSNVYHCKTDDPRFDQEFVDQIEEYERILDIYKRKEVDFRIANLSNKQHAIRHTETRCINAKNDHCFGYSKEIGRVVCTCINTECPKLPECNKNYTKEYADMFQISEDDIKKYGDPANQKRFFLVDIIPDEEMMRYQSDANEDVFVHALIPNPVEKDEISYKKTKIDPITGKTMIVVGYKWIRENDGSYEGNSDHLEPIWDIAREVEEKPVKKIIKAPKIEKLEEPKEKKKKKIKAFDDSDFKNKEEYEAKVNSHIIDEIKLTDLEEDDFDDCKTIIILANIAEKAYVSSMLLNSNVNHGFSIDDQICLMMIDECPVEKRFDYVYISNAVLNNGCQINDVQGWKWLSTMNEINKLSIANREYYLYNNEDISRWCCRNMYGITHVCINDDDILNYKSNNDICSVMLVEDAENKQYQILTSSGDLLGQLNNNFYKLINSMKLRDEISGTPAYINGVSIKVVDGKPVVLGMGHLKFVEY